MERGCIGFLGFSLFIFLYCFGFVFLFLCLFFLFQGGYMDNLLNTDVI